MRQLQGMSVLFTLSVLAIGGAISAAEHPMMGEPAPPFDLPTLDGDQISLDDLRGRYVVLHFGAGW